MHALKIEKLAKTYSNGVKALKDIDLEVEKGDFFALLGANGAGKSTTIGIITTLVTKSQGKIEIFGYDLDSEPEKAKTAVGVVPQEFNFSVFEPPLQILINQAGFYGIPRKEAKQRAELWLKKLDLWHKRHQPSRLLSGGMKRRLMIARALIHDPHLLILDEPTAGVDIELRRSLWDFLREINSQGTTIILTTHYLEEAEQLCKNVAIIDKGAIVVKTSMQDLLQTLDTETLIFYLKTALTAPPVLTPYNARLTSPVTLEVEIHKNQGLNEIFSKLSEQNITVTSMKNKFNRLEELFIGMTKEKCGA